MSQRLKYSILKLSSEDPEFPGAELMVHSSQTKGWQSSRFCDFPQEIGLGFDQLVHLRQVQFLSHQSKIATKIELYTALPEESANGTYENARFKRLGYLSLDSNERSNFQARELKSVYVDVTTQFVKVLFHKCHINKYNLVNQVALIALNCLGEVVGWPRADVAAVSRRSPSAPSGGPREMSDQIVDEMKFDPYTLERIKAVTAAKNRAIELEDYDEAKRCKEMLHKLRTMGHALKELEQKKQEAVRNEEYDVAKSLKIEIDRMHGSISEGADFRSEERQANAHALGRIPEGRSAARNDTRNPPDYPESGYEPHVSQITPAPMSFPSSNQITPAPTAFPGSNQITPAPTAFPSSNQITPAPMSFPSSNQITPAPTAFPSSNGYSPVASQDFHDANNGLLEVDFQKEEIGANAASAHDAVNTLERPIQPHARMDEFPENEVEVGKSPLKGIPNAETLPEPEALNVSFLKEAQPLNDCFGEYIVRCLYSKSWNLREAAYAKLDLDLNVTNEPIGIEKLRCLLGLLKRAATDRIAQVFLTSVQLLQSTLQRMRGQRKSEVQPLFDSFVPLLVERGGDTNARCSTAANESLLNIAKSQQLGAVFTSQYMLRPVKKKNVPARVYVNRLRLLNALANEVGIQPVDAQGIPLEPLMNLAMEWYDNPSIEVRQASVEVVGCAGRKVGVDKIERFLQHLRPAQREVFEQELERMNGTYSPNHSPTSRGQSTRHGSARSDYQVEEPPFTCQFCAKQDPTFTTEGLDIHYWKDCPMLIQCNYCQQVIEIASLREHYLSECESREAANASIDVDTCPLCQAPVEENDDSWRDHLLHCPNNPRKT